MRVGFVTCHLPAPPYSGGRRREYELLRRLAERVDIQLFVLSKTFEEDMDNRHVFDDICSQVRIVPAASDPRLHRCEHQRRHGSRERFVIGAHLDVVHFEGYYMHRVTSVTSSCPTFLLEQNVEHILHAQRGHLLEQLRCEWHEKRTWKKATALGAVSSEDRALMMRDTGRRVFLVPDGVAPNYLSTTDEVPGRMLFVGNFAYEPNRDGIMWFLRDIWPRIKSSVHHATIDIIGPHVTTEIQRFHGNGVNVFGWVPEIEPYMHQAQIVVCPLRVGGGVKVKVLEALGAGKPLVSTSVGMQGLGNLAHERIPAALDDEQFVSKCVQLLNNSRARRARREAAVDVAASLPTWDDAAQAQFAAWETTARLRGTRSRRLSSR
jgi:glycosyltransferase involved in cell wall biosynthesis